MIEHKTVLITGAGANIPYGFPSGEKLSSMSKQEFDQMMKMEYSSESILDFREKLFTLGASSVDQFLEHATQYNEIGKLAISQALIPREEREMVFFTYGVLCSSDNGKSPIAPSTADLEKFIGSWASMYGCSNPPDDTLIISRGPSDLSFKITLHAQAVNADQVDAELTEPDVITIPEQTIGGFPGSGKITYSNDMLSLSQSGLGLTCQGSNCQKI